MTSRPSTAARPDWRRDPYRPLFAEGAFLGLLGVAPFLSGAYGSSGLDGGWVIYHSLAMIEGFLTCFAAGFLFTFLPRRTGTAAPAAWQLTAAALSAALAVLAAALRLRALGQLAWLAGLAVLGAFALPRITGAGGARRLPGAFAWVPCGLVAGISGAALLAISEHLAPSSRPASWALGRGLLTQGLLTCLILGVGSVLIPQLTRGEGLPEALDARHTRRARALHLGAALLYLAGFPVEVFSDPTAGHLLRGLVVLGTLLLAAGVHRPPTVPGLHRRLVWLAAWFLPAGDLGAALFPRWRAAMLHLGFVGGFGLLTLAVSLHVALSHAGRPALLSGSPRPIRALGGLVLAALAFRLMTGIEPSLAGAWSLLAAACFALAIAAWGALALPALRS